MAKERCCICDKKIKGLFVMECKCGKKFCGTTHMIPYSNHGCDYNFGEEDRERFSKNLK